MRAVRVEVAGVDGQPPAHLAQPQHVELLGELPESFGDQARIARAHDPEGALDDALGIGSRLGQHARLEAMGRPPVEQRPGRDQQLLVRRGHHRPVRLPGQQGLAALEIDHGDADARAAQRSAREQIVQLPLGPRARGGGQAHGQRECSGQDSHSPHGHEK